MEKYFRELDTTPFKDKVVLLDLDGTLVPDGKETPAPDEEKVLRAIQSVAHSVVIVSNNLRGRSRALHERYGVIVAESRFKKPSPRSLGDLRLPQGERVVVGDKIITDGWFAHNIGASYIRSKTLFAERESLWLLVVHVFDVAVWRVVLLVPFVVLMRPQQWVKNALIFVPLFFANKLFDLALAQEVFFAFISFSLVASAGYAVNDVKDRAADAAHSVKRARPVASGAVFPRAAVVWAGVLFLGAVFFATAVPPVFPWLMGYAVLSLIYSFFLKHIPLVEILAIAAFFIIRIEAGGAAAEAPVSMWLLVVTFLAAFFVAACKRYAESLREEGKRRAVLSAYSSLSITLLPVVAAILLSTAYVLYSFFGAHFKWAPYSSVFVVFGVLWYLGSMFRGKTEEPDVRFWKDPILFATILSWLTFILIASYR